MMLTISLLHPPTAPILSWIGAGALPAAVSTIQSFHSQRFWKWEKNDKTIFIKIKLIFLGTNMESKNRGFGAKVCQYFH